MPGEKPKIELHPEFWAIIGKYNKRAKQTRPYTLWQLAKTVSDLDGDTAEVGVGFGRGSDLICNATQTRKRTHHIFDSFEGLSEPQKEDFQDWRPWGKGNMAVPEEKVRNNLNHYRHIVYWKGWVPERFSQVSNERFVLVHVDVDLYQPTKDSLEFFFKRLVPGGVLLCDDYSSPRCPGARKAMDDFGHKIGVPVCHMPSSQGAMFQHKGLK